MRPRLRAGRHREHPHRRVHPGWRGGVSEPVDVNGSPARCRSASSAQPTWWRRRRRRRGVRCATYPNGPGEPGGPGPDGADPATEDPAMPDWGARLRTTLHDGRTINTTEHVYAKGTRQPVRRAGLRTSSALRAVLGAPARRPDGRGHDLRRAAPREARRRGRRAVGAALTWAGAGGGRLISAPSAVPGPTRSAAGRHRPVR
ncbi:hypothetical protein HBB16_12550 [Pseudonocardia sp. MCCB 268]|nr:hypothetical protein [Pseudonocardia cytotoxica]